MELLYFSASGVTKRLCTPLGGKSLDEYTGGSYVLAVPTYGSPRTGGYVPDKVQRFVELNQTKLKAVIGVGNRNFGSDFCLGARQLSDQYRVPILALVDLVPNPDQLDIIRHFMEEPLETYYDLNAELNLYDENGKLQLGKDKEAARAYFLEHVNPNTVFFHSLKEKYDYMVEEGYWEDLRISEDNVFGYDWDEIKDVFKHAYSFKFRFPTFVGAYKFYTSYATKTYDGTRYLERFEDRVAMVALYLAEGIVDEAYNLVSAIITGAFQPATPTFLNAGRANVGELVSCFLLRVEDNMESIGRAVNSSLQLSKRGGGVALLLSNIRESGAAIKNVEGASSGIIPIMKLLEDSFSYANQLGARQGAGAVYLHAHHPDIMQFLDTKRENADEKVRIKTLSLGVVIPDVTFDLARDNKDMYLFSPYDVERECGRPFADVHFTELYDEFVENPRIRKTKINAREFFKTLAEVQFESGYPYIMFEDTVNKANPIAGKITHSNLCSEILQIATPSTMAPDLSYLETGRDISCNLGSLNIERAVEGDIPLRDLVETSIRALTSVSDSTAIEEVPTIRRGNDASHAIGLGQMNLHGFLAKNKIEYGSEEALEFVDAYFRTVRFWALHASNLIAMEREQTFEGFEDSDYADGSFFDQYLVEPPRIKSDKVQRLLDDNGITVPGVDAWEVLKRHVKEYGLYNAYLLAVPPTGSISYVNGSTSSIHPVTAAIEIRKEGKMGRTYYPAPFLSEETLPFYEDAYDIGYEKLIDTYAEATKHTDQGLSCTLFFKDTATTRDLNRAYVYAWKKGIRTLYYSRIRQAALEGTEVDTCVSCTL